MDNRAAAENILDMHEAFDENHPDLLERLHRSEAYLPRFLFRGFNLASPTAWIGLNSPQGIFPHAFRPDLNHANRPRRRGFASSTRRDPDAGVHEPPPRLEDLDYWGLQSRALCHIQGDMSPLTPFTSWTADLSTALYFAQGRYRGEGGEWDFFPGRDDATAYLCVLDTWALLLPAAGEQQQRGRRIFHAPVVAGPAAEGLLMEYLVFGPVPRGPHLRCVRLASIRAALSCDAWPACDDERQPPPGRAPHRVTGPEARAALAAGCLFRRRAGGSGTGANTDAGAGADDDDDDDDVDVVLAVAAGLLAAHQRRVESPRPLEHATVMMLTYFPRAAPAWPEGSVEAVLGCLGLGLGLDGEGEGAAGPTGAPPVSGRPLVNPVMDVRGAPQLRLARDLLCALDAALGGSERGRTLSGDEWERILRIQVDRDEGAGHICQATGC